MTKYELLDSKIMNKIGGHPTPFSKLFVRDVAEECTRAGLAAAREQGRIGGRRRIMTPEVVEHSRRMLRKGATRQQVASVVGVGVKTIYKYLPVG